MSTSAVSSNLISQQTEGKLQQRRADLQQLGQDLQSGNLAGAQQDFAQFQSSFRNRPSSDAGPAVVVNLGGSSSAGITSAADTPPVSTGGSEGSVTSAGDTPPVNVGGSGGSSGSSAITSSGDAPPIHTGGGPEIILNLGNVTAGEQITIGLNNAANGTEQLTIGVANQPGQSPEQITLNLNQSGNQEIVLNFFNSSSNSNAGSGTVAPSGVSVTA